MTDAEFESEKARVTAIKDRWTRNLGLGWWTIAWVFDRERDDEDAQCAGRATARWEYMHGAITFFLPVTKEMTDAELEKVFVHECTHLLVSPMHKEHGPEEEYACTLLTNALLWTAHPEETEAA